jgi:transposase
MNATWYQTSMPAVYENLQSYLEKRFPRCRIEVMYEAGFGGFWLHDQLVANGVKCVVTPAHTVTQEKVSMVKTDKVDARRLARNLESGATDSTLVKVVSVNFLHRIQ